MSTSRRAAFADLDAGTLYGLLRLRVDVFVVEQDCPYPDLDGRDTEPATEHRWIEDDAGPAAYLRVLAEPGGGVRIGRVCTRADARGRGLAARLTAEAVADHGFGPIVLDAQSPVAALYTRFGFAVTGPEFLDDGIPHVPMLRPPS